MNGNSTQSRRRGFTLVELLVVIAIITILAALSISVVYGVMSNARESATNALLTKIEGRMKDRMQTLSGLDYAQYESRASSVGFSNPAEKKVIAKKLALLEAFPQTWEEVDLYHQAWAAEIVSKYGANKFDPTTESAEVLYYILTEGPTVGRGKRKLISGVSQIEADEFSAQETADTDGDGLLELVDGWEQPLRFYRWPTRLIRPLGFDGGSLNIVDLTVGQILIPAVSDDSAKKDVDDPLNVMPSTTAYSGEQFETDYHTWSTYHVPLVVSAGPDGKLGLYEPSDKDNFGHVANVQTLDDIYDNISNLNKSAGGN